MQYGKCLVSSEAMRERSLFMMKRALIAFSISLRRFSCRNHLANMVLW